MIIYSKTLWGLPLLTRFYGSALPRAIAPAVISGLLTVVLLFLGDRVASLWQNPFAYQPFVLLVSFVLTFRSNYAYQRHWEAYTQMSIMTARWVDAAVQIIMFDQYPTEPDHHDAHHQQHQQGRRPQHPISSRHGSTAQQTCLAGEASHAQFVADLVHLISLLHGVSSAALRRDPDLSNMKRHSRLSAAPPSDPALLDKEALEKADAAGQTGTAAAGAAGGGNDDVHKEPVSPRVAAAIKQWAGYGDANIVGGANWRDIFMLRGSSSAIRKYNAAQPLPVIGGVSKHEMAALGCRFGCSYDTDADQSLGLCTDEGWGGIVPGRFPHTAVVGGAAGAQGATQHHQQQHQGGFLATSVSKFTNGFSSGSTGNVWSFLRNGQQQQEQHPEQFRHGVSSPALQKTSIAGSKEFGKTGDCNSEGLRRRVRRDSRRFKVSQNHTCCGVHLPYMDRPVLVMTWIHELLLRRQQEGGLRVPAPILARVHTCLSDGFLGFEQCRKLADTPFPFPWAQFVFMMLVLFTATLPLLVLAYIPNSVLAVVLTVVTVLTYWAVNEVARDVEDPFLFEPNDMPLANGQYHMNEMLLALASSRRPASGVMPVHLPMAAGPAAAGAAAAALGVRVGSSGLPLRSLGSISSPNLAQTVEVSSEEADMNRYDVDQRHDGDHHGADVGDLDGQKYDDLVETRDVNNSGQYPATTATAAAGMGEAHGTDTLLQQQARAAAAAAAAAVDGDCHSGIDHSRLTTVRQRQQRELELPNLGLHVTPGFSAPLAGNAAATAATTGIHTSTHAHRDAGKNSMPAATKTVAESPVGDMHAHQLSQLRSPRVSPAPAGPGASTAADAEHLSGNAPSVRLSGSVNTSSKVEHSQGGIAAGGGVSRDMHHGVKTGLGVPRSTEVADMV